MFRATAAEQRLEQAGMEPKVARAVTEALEDMHGSLTTTLVTKDYLDSQLKSLENRIVLWIAGMGGAIFVTILVALLRDFLTR